MDELELKTQENQAPNVQDTEVPLDKNLRLMSPGMMVVRRFFRSKLSIVGLVMVIGLFLFITIETNTCQALRFAIFGISL